MPQGVTNAPSTFQRLMEKCMGDMNLKEVVVFLDDLIVFSETLEDHEARLTKVLNCLKEYGLKIFPRKNVGSSSPQSGTWGMWSQSMAWRPTQKRLQC